MIEREDVQNRPNKSAQTTAHMRSDAPDSARPSISVFFPAYNDAGTIASMVLAALSTCSRLTDDYEVIVVENGSTDYTVEVLEDLAASYSKLRIFTSREVLG